MKSVMMMSMLLVAVGANTVLLRNTPFIPIRSFSHEIGRDGVYSVRSEGGDGTVMSENGALILPAGFKEAGATKNGQYSYTSPEGRVITTSYTADEQGFKVTGDHLPVGPEMPEAIRAMLPTLPKLVEVEERSLPIVHEQRQFHHQRHHQAPVVIRESSPVFVSAPQRTVLVQEAAPEKMFVQTPEFLIDSHPTKTLVRIGN